MRFSDLLDRMQRKSLVRERERLADLIHSHERKIRSCQQAIDRIDRELATPTPTREGATNP